jgi:hypothetical protein
MTTVLEFTAVRLAITFHLPVDQACEIVSQEAASWARARIPFGWQQDITQASYKVKALAWYSAMQRYREVIP